MKHNSSAFIKGESSLFIIETPFQAMCAINAIRQLEIVNYTLSLHLHPTTEKRNKQTIELVQRYGLEYTVFKQVPLTFHDRLSLMFKHKGSFSRVFLGTHLYQNGYYYALKQLRKGGNLVLLDDGVATLSLLQDEYKVTGRSVIFMIYYKVIASLRSVCINNVLTVYRNINNPKWNISVNDISMLRQSKPYSEKKGVYFIGTNNGGYIKEGINEKLFRKTVFDCLSNVKKQFPNEEIVYIPHGRDNSTFAKDFCEELGMEYKPLDINVEIYILSLATAPIAIYGFASSALYNLKMIFPELSINNLVMNILLKKYHSLLYTSEYYENHGIRLIYV